MNLNKKFIGFTLAEVLITLAIVGVVASITIPSLMNNYLKNATVTKLQKCYTTMYQVIKLSEQDNGPVNTWTFCAANDGPCTLTWYKQYLEPYIKSVVTYVASDNTSAFIYLLDGTKIYFLTNGASVDVGFYLNGDKTPSISGKDKFIFKIMQTAQSNPFVPYDYGASGSGRSKWTTGANACTSASSTKLYCAGLIMYDGWQISSDYPYFN